MIGSGTEEEKGAQRTEELLEKLYPRVTERLAEHFRELTRYGQEQTETLSRLAEDLGISVDPRWQEKPGPEVDRMVWRPVARSCVLALLRAVVARLEAEGPFKMEPDSWADLAWKQPGSEELPQRMALSEKDAHLALEVAARELVAAEELSGPIHFRHVPLVLDTTGERVVVNPTEAEPELQYAAKADVETPAAGGTA